MVDPVSIAGLIGASLTITMRAATIGKDLYSLKARLKGANSKIGQLSIHISAIRVAARSLSSWLEADAVGSEEVEDVKGELLDVLSACCNLLSDLQDFVVKVLAGTESVGFKGAAMYIFDEEMIKETTETLHHQENALLLMLQALSLAQKRDQRDKLTEPKSLVTLEKAKRPSSSIIGLRAEDRSSMRFSFASDHSETLDTMFIFDLEVMASAAYRNAFTSLLKRKIVQRDEQSSLIDTNQISSATTTNIELPQHDQGLIETAIENGLSTQSNAMSVPIEINEDIENEDIENEAAFWIPQATPDGRLFYFNTLTGVSTMELPLENGLSPQLNAMSVESNEDIENEEAAFWIPQATPDGRLFYFNTLTGVSTMELPLETPTANDSAQTLSKPTYAPNFSRLRAAYTLHSRNI